MNIALDSIQTPALTKADIAAQLCSEVGLSQRESKAVVESICEIVLERLVAGEDVRISGFGNFNLRDKSARPGRNPRTGEFRLIAPRRVVTFHASNKLRSSLQGSEQIDDVVG